MAQIASGASATVSLAAGSIIKVPAGNFQAVAMLGPGPQRGQMKTLGLSDGIIGPFPGAQDIYLTSMSGLFQYFVLRADYATSGTPVLLTAAEIASPSTALLADTKATYQLDTAPYTRYQSNGTALAQVGSGGSAGSTTFVDVTADRNLLSTDIGKQLNNASASNYAITIRTNAVETGAGNAGWTAGNVFAISRTGTGTISITAGAGVTVNNIGTKVAAQNDTPLVVQMSPVADTWNIL